jgi:glycosyltransferase involved in cell wall biosynthesis
MVRQRMSVAMCTFNGAAHLREQLDSIALQTRQPDEIVICDDGSQDGSIDIVQAYSKVAPLEVRLYVNDRNLGVTQNFAKAVALCHGDVIALSDQDDVWHSDKLERMEEAFSSSPNVGAVFTEANFVNEQLEPLGLRMSQYLGLNRKGQRDLKGSSGFSALLRVNVPGCTLAFRASFKEACLPIPAMWHHDTWIALIVAGLADVSFLKEPLVEFRRHPRNLSEAAKLSFRELLTVARNRAPVAEISARRFQLLYDRLHELPENRIKAGVLQQVLAKIRHLHARQRIISGPGLARLPRLIVEAIALNYHRYSAGWRSMARDLLIKRGNPPQLVLHPSLAVAEATRDDEGFEA